jgi:flagellar basal body-associated protein FliL
MDPIQPQVSAEGSKKALGPVIGIIVIVVLLVVGAFYVWGGKISTPAPKVETSQVAPVSKSDEVSSIGADLNASDTASVDLSGLDSI